MRRILTIIGLQAYALILAFLQAAGGVRTDEAKYLLNIPYPHPPFARSIIGATEFLPSQELFWRIVFATLLVQAVWIVWNMTRPWKIGIRLAACGLWLVSGGVLLQAGSIMMAPLTALQALVFSWLFLKEEPLERFAPWIALLWLCSLFTALQALLFFPLVAGIFLRMRLPIWQRATHFFLPLFLVLLALLANPLILASIVIHGSRDLHATVFDRLRETARLWAIGGSVVLSILGTIGIVRSLRWELIGSFLLVSLYIALSRYDYYAVFYLPPFVAGFIASPIVRRWDIVILPSILVSAALWILYPLPSIPGSARITLEQVSLEQGKGDLFIAGSFGHDWQYESPVPVRRYSFGALADAQAVVCLETCPKMLTLSSWKNRQIGEAEVWSRYTP